MNKVRLSSCIFHLSDQQKFADFSGDINPIHLCDEYARKTPPGQVIVHGINSLLWALDGFLSCGHSISGQMNVRFLQPIHLNEVVFCDYFVKERIIEISNANVIFVKIKLSDNFYNHISGDSESLYSKTSYDLQICELALNDIQSGLSLALSESADPDFIDELYPALLVYLGRSIVCQIACLSSVVGMQIPGLHSIFASVSIDLQKSSNRKFVEVVKTDQRFGLVDLKVQSSDVHSKVRAIIRPKPTECLPLDSLKKKINKTFAVGESVLVIGGSRGLGSYVVKILALSGARVTFTYSKGQKDAQILKSELSGSNINVDFVHFDIRDLDFSALFDCKPDYIFYFATPKIFVKRSKCFENKLYEGFKLFYVDAFKSILENSGTNSVKGIFYPSSVAVEENTKDLAEYIKAKLEGEELSKQANIANKTNIFISRLPRTLTDQTATNLTIESKDPFEVMMPILEEFF